MADTGGIAALLKALNETPGLGSGLKPASPAVKPSAVKSGEFAAAAGIGKSAGPARSSSVAATAATARTAGTTATTGTTASRAVRTAAADGTAPAPKPRSPAAPGHAYDTKAPRGTYVNIIV